MDKLVYDLLCFMRLKLRVIGSDYYLYFYATNEEMYFTDNSDDLLCFLIDSLSSNFISYQLDYINKGPLTYMEIFY